MLLLFSEPSPALLWPGSSPLAGSFACTQKTGKMDSAGDNFIWSHINSPDTLSASRGTSQERLRWHSRDRKADGLWHSPMPNPRRDFLLLWISSVHIKQKDNLRHCSQYSSKHSLKCEFFNIWSIGFYDLFIDIPGQASQSEAGAYSKYNNNHRVNSNIFIGILSITMQINFVSI